MYVLMDMEWYEQNSTQIPTQLAAMRVDDELNYIDMFYTRINPGPGNINWSHIAFKGGTESQFKSASSLHFALHRFECWLNEDDVLIWWHESGADFFKKLCECNDIMVPQIGVIHGIVRKKLVVSGHMRGGTYELAKHLSLQVPDTEHYAPNDVAVLQRLLCAGCIPPSALVEAGCLVWTPYVKPENVKISKPKQKIKQKKPPQPQHVDNSFKYYHDITTGLFHKVNCGNKTHDKSKLQGFQTLKGCIRRNLIPCECCAAETEQYLSKTGRTNLSLQYSINSRQKLVHFPDCKILGRIKPENLKEFKSIREARECGYAICPICNPMLILYNKEKPDLEKYCTENRLNFTMKDDVAYIISRHDF